MTFLPIVERELRVAARKRGTQWLRFFAALLVIVVVFVILLGTNRSVPGPRLGQQVFYAVSGMAMVFCALAGVFLTSDCLCSEKRDGTLGLLFLTDLKGYDVVLGKLAATSMVSAYAVLAIIPMLGLPLLMGGISVAEFGRMSLVLVMTLLLSLGTGMFVSALCRETRTAMLASFGVILLLTGIPYVAALSIYLFWNVDAFNVVLLPSPILAYVHSFDSTFGGRGGAERFWTSVSLLGGLALAQLALASWWLPRTWQEGSGVAEAKSGQRFAASPVQQEMLARNPFEWLVARDCFPGWPTRIVLGFLFLVWFGFFLGPFFSKPTGAAARGQEWMFVTAFFFAYGLHFLIKGLVAVQASRRLCEERRSGALELLLCTPLPPAFIIEGQRRVMWRQFRRLLAALLAVNLALAWFLLPRRLFDMSDKDAAIFISFFLGGIPLLWVDFNAIGWVGMWMGLRGLPPSRAALNTFVRVMAPPLLTVLLFVFIGINAKPREDSIWGFWMAWVTLGVVSAWTAVRHRRAELFRDFRRLASGDKRKTAFDAFLPWVEGWRSDGSSESRRLARQRATHSGDGLSVRPASNASGDKQDHHASGRGVRL